MALHWGRSTAKGLPLLARNTPVPPRCLHNAARWRPARTLFMSWGMLQAAVSSKASAAAVTSSATTLGASARQQRWPNPGASLHRCPPELCPHLGSPLPYVELCCSRLMHVLHCRASSCCSGVHLPGSHTAPCHLQAQLWQARSLDCDVQVCADLGKTPGALFVLSVVQLQVQQDLGEQLDSELGASGRSSSPVTPGQHSRSHSHSSSGSAVQFSNFSFKNLEVRCMGDQPTCGQHVKRTCFALASPRMLAIGRAWSRQHSRLRSRFCHHAFAWSPSATAAMHSSPPSTCMSCLSVRHAKHAKAVLMGLSALACSQPWPAG